MSSFGPCESCPPAEVGIKAVPRASHRSRPAAFSAWAGAFAACGAFEWATLAYLFVLNFLIVVFRRNLAGAPAYLLAHFGLALAIVALCWADARCSSPALRFLRHWYPMLLFLAFFEELHYLAHLVFPGWYDRWLIQSDYALLGVHPTVWFEQFARPGPNDFMQFTYMSYYFYGVILGGVLYVRNETRAFWRVMTATGVSYYLGYLVSIFFPIEGPFHALAGLHQVDLAGGFFTSVIDFIERFGRVHGAAFPSAHVSGSLVALIGAWRYRRGLFWVFLPLFASMLVATVYGRYHYVADVVAGLLFGALGWAIVDSARREAWKRARQVK